MADYSGYYDADKFKSATPIHNEIKLVLPEDEDLDRLVELVAEKIAGRKTIKPVESINEDDAKDGDVRSDYSKGFDKGWFEGYEAALHEASVAVIKAIHNL